MAGFTPLPTSTSAEDRHPTTSSNYQPLAGAYRSSETQEQMDTPQNPESPTGSSAANSHPAKRTENRPTASIRPESRASPIYPMQRITTKLSKSFSMLETFNCASQHHFIRFLIIKFATKKKQITFFIDTICM